MSENAFPDALAPGYRLHWYVLEQVLGQGGFGITYLARDTNLDQPVAIKEYLPVEVAGRRSDSSVRARTEEHDERYRWGLDRYLLSSGANAYARTILGIRTRDATAGFKCWRRSALEAIDVDRILSDGYIFQVEMTYVAERLSERWRPLEEAERMEVAAPGADVE